MYVWISGMAGVSDGSVLGASSGRKSSSQQWRHGDWGTERARGMRMRNDTITDTHMTEPAQTVHYVKQSIPFYKTEHHVYFIQIVSLYWVLIIKSQVVQYPKLYDLSQIQNPKLYIYIWSLG